jgi:hypothetical protein
MSKRIIDISAGVTEEGVIPPTPLWLTDPDVPAPCPCGKPFTEHEPQVLIIGDTGLKRLFHIECIGGNLIVEDDDE